MRRLILPALVLALAACAPPAEETAAPTPAATTTLETTEAATERATTASPSAEPTEAAAECDPETPDTPLATALAGTDLPDGVTVQGVQETAPDSDQDQSLTWVIVRLCTAPLDDTTFRTIATDLAITARDADGGGDHIWRLDVQQWVPGTEQLERGDSLHVEDFGGYTWDRDAARAPESIWTT